MLDLQIDSEILESKEIIKKIRQDLLDYATQGENQDFDSLQLIDDYKKIIDKINSNLNFLKRNWVTIESYISDFDEIANNEDYLRVYNSNKIKYESDAVRRLNYFLKDSYDDFKKLTISVYLDDFSVQNINRERLNVIYKLQYELEHIIQKTKENIIQFKPIVEDYRNNIKMIPVFEASRKSIEANLNKYIDLKKSEMDRYLKSLKDEFNSVNNRLRSFDSDFDRLKKSNSTLNSDQNLLQNKITTLKNDLLDFDQIYKKNELRLEEKMGETTEFIKSEIYKDFNVKLKKLTSDLDIVYQMIDDEVNSLKDTSRSFKDFISDETSIKLTDDYKNKAKFEMLSYYLFNILSLIIIGFAIYFSYSSLSDFAVKHKGSYTSLDLTYLAIRLIFSVLIFSTIAFTSRLASKSYIYWKKNEGIFLRLTALKSFIADMSEAKKEEIHEKLVDVYFGKDEQEQNLNQKLKDLPNNITQLLGKVVDQTSVVLDASKPKKDTETPTDRANGGG
ncbi:hypothetical protein F8N28_12380 [Acinetobacter soli]|uniref:hypothetical protein n=1 Tax=Acinetobacter soli TaxID=487316 RepID=UPI003B883BFB